MSLSCLAAAFIFQSMLSIFFILYWDESFTLPSFLFGLMNEGLADLITSIFILGFKRCDPISSKVKRPKKGNPFIGIPKKHNGLSFEYDCVDFFRIKNVRGSLSSPAEYSRKKKYSALPVDEKVMEKNMTLNHFYNFSLDSDPVYKLLKQTELVSLSEMLDRRVDPLRPLYNPSNGKNPKQDHCFNYINSRLNMERFEGLINVKPNVEVFLRFERVEFGFSIEVGIVKNGSFMDRFSTFGSADFLNSVLNIILIYAVFEVSPLTHFINERANYISYHSEGIFESAERLLNCGYVVSILDNDKDVLCLYKDGNVSILSYYSLLISYLGIFLSFFVEDDLKQKKILTLSLCASFVSFYFFMNFIFFASLFKCLLSTYLVSYKGFFSDRLKLILKNSRNILSPCDWVTKEFSRVSDGDYFLYIPGKSYDCNFNDTLGSSPFQSLQIAYDSDDLNFDFDYKMAKVNFRVGREIKGLHSFTLNDVSNNLIIHRFVDKKDLHKIFCLREMLLLFSSDCCFKGVMSSTFKVLGRKFVHVRSLKEIVEGFLDSPHNYFIKITNSRLLNSVVALTDISMSKTERQLLFDHNFSEGLLLKVFLHNIIFFRGYDHLSHFLFFIPGSNVERKNSGLSNKCFKKYGSDLSKLYKCFGLKPLYRMTILNDSEALTIVNSIDLNGKVIKISNNSKNCPKDEYIPMDLKTDEDDILSILSKFGLFREKVHSLKIENVLSPIAGEIEIAMGSFLDRSSEEGDIGAPSDSLVEDGGDSNLDAESEAIYNEYSDSICKEIVSFVSLRVRIPPPIFTKNDLKRLERLEEKMLKLENIKSNQGMSEHEKWRAIKGLIGSKDSSDLENLKMRREKKEKMGDPLEPSEVVKRENISFKFSDIERNIDFLLEKSRKSGINISMKQFRSGLMDKLSVIFDGYKSKHPKLFFYKIKENEGKNLKSYIPLVKFENPLENVLKVGLNSIKTFTEMNSCKELTLFNVLTYSNNGFNFSKRKKVKNVLRKKGNSKSRPKNKTSIYYKTSIKGGAPRMFLEVFRSNLNSRIETGKTLNLRKRCEVSNSTLKSFQVKTLYKLKKYLNSLLECNAELNEKLKRYLDMKERGKQILEEKEAKKTVKRLNVLENLNSWLNSLV